MNNVTETDIAAAYERVKALTEAANQPNISDLEHDRAVGAVIEYRLSLPLKVLDGVLRLERQEELSELVRKSYLTPPIFQLVGKAYELLEAMEA